MARVTKTPGVTTEPTADAVDQAQLPQGGDSDSNSTTNTGDQSTSETSTASEPVEPTAEEIQAKKEYEEFLEWRKTKGKSSEPVAPHVPTSNVSAVAKRTRQVVGKHGWTTEEY